MADNRGPMPRGEAGVLLRYFVSELRQKRRGLAMGFLGGGWCGWCWYAPV